ncbi:MAG: MerR family transcriptional regulator [Bacteroidetes bacterium]|nr:MerR family transcriptional regulator [Bacteroidota bacterium]MBK9672696.1 MerR family transcriptional regulator [Bacteroidota bacterium]MBK9800284.1 MerR family transcriptional regulator [Bacteroidota bacterium]MBP6412442.1 MerR family transcriptional regulator [Bacteroidia bacterium]
MKFSANYSIKDLEKLSGIKAHTLRIWEKRYALFEPERTDTNIRFYTNNDLKRILNISMLNKSGFKISKIAALNEAQIAAKVSEITNASTSYEEHIDKFIMSMIDLNEASFDKTFSDCVSNIGFEDCIQKVVVPFFIRIGTMWQTGSINPAQEHFVSNIVRQKIIVAIDSIKQSSKKSKGTVLLFLPENELHELSLLFYAYALKMRNYKIVYLGQSVPTDTLVRVSEIVKPDILLSVITAPPHKGLLDSLINTLASLKPKRTILLSGRAVFERKKKLPPSISLFKGFQELLKLI